MFLFSWRQTSFEASLCSAYSERDLTWSWNYQKISFFIANFIFILCNYIIVISIKIIIELLFFDDNSNLLHFNILLKLYCHILYFIQFYTFTFVFIIQFHYVILINTNIFLIAYFACNEIIYLIFCYIFIWQLLFGYNEIF